METDAGSSQHDDDVQRPSPSTTPNYAAQMGRVLGDDDEDEEADEFDSFVYSGADADEAAQQALYQQQLADVLDSPTEANSQPPPAAQPSIPQTNGVLHHVPPVPGSPAATRLSSASNDTFPGFGTPSNYLNNAKSAAISPRRPSMHPQISRLRSTTPQQRFPSNSSYSTALEHPGDSPGTSPFDLASRRSSISNIFEAVNGSDLATPAESSQGGTEAGTHASETFKWSQLKRLSSRIYPSATRPGAAVTPSQLGALGAPTVMAVNGVVAIGTVKGWAMVFDFSQNLRCVCGTEAVVKEAGSVTALAISQDHTFIAVGHATGHIHLYDLRQPNKPARSVAPTSLQLVSTGRKEGHLSDSRILHLGFIGARHTAIVSSDEKGLAFYHSLGKVLMLASTDIIRMLGRYPDSNSPAASPRPPGSSVDDDRARANRSKKPSTILDMAPLPLGPAPHSSDFHSLVALLTPTKLVVVGLKPTPRTWWRAQPAKDGVEAGAEPGNDYSTSGVLSWWPSMTRDGAAPPKAASSGKERLAADNGEDPWLAFAWGRRVRLVRVKQGAKSADQGLDVDFAEERSFESEHRVLGLRWYSARIVFVLTPHHLDVWDVKTCTLIGRDAQDAQHIVAHDYYASNFEPLRHSGDMLAYSGSFVVYKKKVFLLTANDVRVAALLSWADRILNLMQPGTILEAIEVATAYLLGQTDASTITLPEDAEARRDIVEPRVREILSASLEFVFAEDRLRDGSHDDGETVQRLFEGLVGTCVRACIVTGDVDWLFDELYERYEQNGIESIFLDRIEPFVLAGSVHALPPSVSQRLIAIHDERGEYDAAQRIIWHVDPEAIDINQALRLCQREKLYDALIYVYMRSLHDYVAPLVELLALIRQIQQHRRHRPSRVDDDYMSSSHDRAGLEGSVPDAYKIFAYLSHALVGLSYPNKDPLAEDEALNARNSTYAFLFSGRTQLWPAQGGKPVLTVSDDGSDEPTYPYLRLLLAFDSEATLDVLDLGFEDPYLDDEVVGKSLNRQVIVDTLLAVVLDDGDRFSSTDRTFVRIFVARNLPKYPQYLRLRPEVVHGILVGLASDPDLSTTEDRQLAAEYLLSVYSPEDSREMVALFEQAGFLRILRSIYRGERRWAALASTYLRDEDVGSDVFQFLGETLKLASRASTQQKEELASTILDAIPSLLQTDELALQHMAQLFDHYLPGHHVEVIARLSSSTWRQFAYLRCLLEPAFSDSSDSPDIINERPPSTHLAPAQRRQYLSLLCAHEPYNVIRYLDFDATGLAHDVEAMLICEDAEAFDAVIWSLDKRGATNEALEKVDETLETRTDELVSSLLGNDVDVDDRNGLTSSATRNDVVLAQISAISKVAIQICSRRAPQKAHNLTGEDMWFRLLASLVSTVRAVRGAAPTALPQSPVASRRRLSSASIIIRDDYDDDHDERAAAQALSVRASDTLASLIPMALSSLVSTTSSRDVSFPRLMRRLIEDNTHTKGTNGSYAEFRTIVSSMLDTYAFEGDLLHLASNIFSQDLFEHVETLKVERERGWRARGDVCEDCAQPVWGPAGQGSPPMSRSASVSMVVETMGMSGRPRMKKRPSLKGKEVDWPEHDAANVAAAAAAAASQQVLDPPTGIVVGRDGRLWHQSCHLLSRVGGGGLGTTYRMRRERSLM